MGFLSFDKYETKFRRFYSWADRWTTLLEPLFAKTQEQIAEDEETIGAVLPPDEKVRRAWGRIGDNFGELAYPLMRSQLYLGQFVGAKFAGATREQLQEKGARMLDVIMRAEVGRLEARNGSDAD